MLFCIVYVYFYNSSIDKLLHSLGYKMGYALNKNVLPNPLDYIMVESQKVTACFHDYFIQI